MHNIRLIKSIKNINYILKFIEIMETGIKEQSVVSYLRQRVTPILEPLQFEILLHKPANIYDYSYKWLKNQKKNQLKNEGIHKKISQDSGDEFEHCRHDDEQRDEIYFQKLKNKGRRRKSRKGISGQVYSTLKSQDFTKVYGQKCEQDRIKILINLKNSVLFRNISQNNISQIIDCMQKRCFQAGEVVIKEGEIGDELFLVASGMFKCEVQGNKEFDKIYQAGQIFGELSLLYDTKRASTITAIVTGKLFVLNRKNFNCILRDEVIKKTKLCQETLSKNQLFQSMSQYQRSKIAENLKQMTAPAGKYIIKEGQIGDRFFIVCSGNLVAEKQMQDHQIKSVFYYKEGDYFGQISLIRNVPRQASVKALITSKLLFIERSAFKRLLGSSEYMMKLREQKYKQLNQQK